MNYLVEYENHKKDYLLLKNEMHGGTVVEGGCLNDCGRLKNTEITCCDDCKQVVSQDGLRIPNGIHSKECSTRMAINISDHNILCLCGRYKAAQKPSVYHGTCCMICKGNGKSHTDLCNYRNPKQLLPNPIPSPSSIPMPPLQCKLPSPSATPTTIASIQSIKSIKSTASTDKYAYVKVIGQWGTKSPVCSMLVEVYNFEHWSKYYPTNPRSTAHVNFTGYGKDEDKLGLVGKSFAVEDAVVCGDYMARHFNLDGKSYHITVIHTKGVPITKELKDRYSK